MFTVTVLTKNCETKIQTMLASVAWAPEVVVLDTGSTDRTLEIAASFPNVNIFHSPFSGFGALHNEMAALASNDWILSIDSDEVVSDSLKAELQSLTLDSNSVYSMPRHNFFQGKWIRGCGWHPDRVVRLYHRGRTQFSADQVHERVLTEGLKRVDLNAPLHHFSYESVADFLTKMQLYTDLFARQNKHRRTSSLFRALVAKWMAFVRSYVFKLGFRDGYQGWIISSYNAQTAYYKYIKLKEINDLVVE